MFSGIGGFEYGMELSKMDFECVGYSEIDENAKSIYQRHYPKHINFGDATRIKTEKLPDFDFLVGGFPCQSFSIAGNRQGLDDTRGTLFFEIARILKDKRPRYFLLENVKNLLSHDKGNTFKTITGVLSELGYTISWKIYNSRNHGVPQNRERIFITGCYNEGGGGFEILFKRRNNEKANDGRVDGYWLELKPNLKITVTSQGDAFAVVGHEPCRPFYKRASSYVLDDKGLRKLTTNERELLQGFPIDWTKYGANGKEISKTQRQKCCGNAVTTFVVRDIINEIFGEDYEHRQITEQKSSQDDCQRLVRVLKGCR